MAPGFMRNLLAAQAPLDGTSGAETGRKAGGGKVGLELLWMAWFFLEGL